MKRTALLLLAVLLSLLALPAQSPPISAFYPVGWINSIQPSSGHFGARVPGEQFVGARTLGPDHGPGTWSAADGVRIGRRLWWWTCSAQVGVSPARFHATSSSPANVFALATFSNSIVTMPGAAAGFDHLLVSAGAVLASPFTSTLHTTSFLPGFVAVPSGGYDVHWLYWDVPNDPALVGQVLELQGARIEPSNGLFYLSDELLVEIVI